MCTPIIITIIHGSLGPQESAPKRHLNLFIRFRKAQYRDQYTDKHTDRPHDCSDDMRAMRPNVNSAKACRCLCLSVALCQYIKC